MTPANLTSWRQGEELTQREAARIAGVTIRSWQRWESGEREIPQWLADTLRQRFGAAPRP